MVRRTGHPDFLDLPWHLPLEEWTSQRLVDVPTGISRHVVRFVEYGGGVYALAELAELSIPVVEVAGVVVERDAADREELDAVLITRHLDYSLPYSRVLGASG